MKKIITLSLLSLLLGACNTTSGGDTAPTTTDSRPCMQNFSQSGSVFSGRSFKTFEVIQGVNKNTAFNRASRQLVASGLSITSTDRELGMITAANAVSMSGGKGSVPLTVVITPVSGGIKVENNFVVAGGLVTSLGAIQKTFCDINAAVKGQ